MNLRSKAVMRSQEEDKLSFVGRWDARNRGRMALSHPKSWQAQQDERPWSPRFQLSRANHNFSDSSREVDECCAAGADVVVCIAHGAEKAFEEVQTDRYVDVNSGV